MTFNLTDLALACILVVSLIFSRGLNFFKELIKFFGVLLATILTLHYYIPFGDFLKFKQLISEPLNYVMAFILSIAVVIFLFSILSEGWLLIIKFELVGWLEKRGSWFFSLLRTYFVFGLIYVSLLVFGGSVEVEARNSFSRVIFGNASLWVYKGFFSNLVHPFFPDEEINQKVVELISGEKLDKEEIVKEGVEIFEDVDFIEDITPVGNVEQVQEISQ